MGTAMAMRLESYATAHTASFVGAAVVASAILWVVSAGIYNLITSPIPFSVPGPFIARLTNKWILLLDMTNRRASVVDALHKKYGPVVRLSPNELSFACREAVRPIYGHQTTCIKAPVYEIFGRPSSFLMRDVREHRQRQRRIAHIFSVTSLRQMEPLVQSVIDRTVNTIEMRASNAVDTLHWCRMMALDVAGEVLMGRNFGAFDGEGQAPVFVKYLDNAALSYCLQAMAPGLFRLLGLLPLEKLQSFLASSRNVYAYGQNAFDEYIKLNGRTSARPTLLTKLIAGNPEKGIEPLSDEEITVEVSNLTFGAVDTTSITATYALYRLCCHPVWQTRLREEIRKSRPSRDDFSYTTLQNLPILNAVLVETMRLHPPLPNGLLRETTAPITTIAGLDLPAKTLVSMQARTTQRDAACFPDPNTFDPGRWINADGTINPGTPEQNDMIFVWGKGSRACLGQYLATMELKILLAQLMNRFDVRLASEMTHEEMKMTDGFSSTPKGRCCHLVFSEVWF